MDVLKFKEWLESRKYSMPIYLLLLPDKPDNAISFQVVEGVGSRGVVTNFTVNFYIRANHPSEAMQTGTEIINDLDNRTRVFLENEQIILMQALTSVPIPVGMDENKRHIFNVQIKLLMSPTDKLNTKE